MVVFVFKSYFAAIGAKYDRPQYARPSFKRGYRRRAGKVPDLDRAVESAAGQQLSVGRKNQGIHSLLMRVNYFDQGSGQDIPEPDLAVTAAINEGFSIRGEDKRIAA